MHLSKLIGKTLTNIFIFAEFYVDGLDHAKCYLEIDGQQIILIPFSGDTEVRFASSGQTAESISDWDKMKHIQNQKIADVLWFKDDVEFDEPGYIQLNNGCIITEVTTFPSGAAAVGLQFYADLDELLAEKEYSLDELIRISGVLGDS